MHNSSNPFETPVADFNTRRTEITERHSVDLTHILEMTTFGFYAQRKNNKKKKKKKGEQSSGAPV